MDTLLVTKYFVDIIFVEEMNKGIEQYFFTDNWSITKVFVVVGLVVFFVSIWSKPSVQPRWPNERKTGRSRYIFNSKFLFIFGVIRFFIMGRFHIFIVVIVVGTDCGGTMVMFLFTRTIIVKSVQSWDPIQNYFWYQFIKLKDNKYWTKNYQWHLKW